MVVRVDREIFDPVGVGSTSGGVGTVYEDGTRPNPWEPRPFQTKTEYIVSEAMRLMSVPADVIRQARPPVPIELFPPQLGYGPNIALTINDVLQTDRWAPTIRSWTSGTPRTPRHVDTDIDMWSGTLRNFQSSPNMAG
jgi:hypothetical protein